MIDENNTVFTEVEINATPEQVWAVLTDWEKLPRWSSSLQGISPEGLSKGEVSKAFFKNPITGKNVEFEHEITEYEEGKKFGWSGIVMGSIKDHHIYSLEDTGRGTTLFRQEDGFHSEHSSHSRFMNFISKHGMADNYKKFNQELKERVEELYPKS